MNTQTKKRAIKLGIISLFSAVIVTVAVSVAWMGNSTQANAEKGTEATKSSASLFSFNGLVGWTQGPSNETSLALFSEKRDDGTSACFVSTEYNKGTVDIEKSLNDKSKKLEMMGSSMTFMSVNPASLQSSNKSVTYNLDYYSVDPGSNKLMGGLALGYAQLDDGYVTLNGNCEKAEDLTTVSSALQAIKVNK